MAYQLKEINHAVRTDPIGFMEACDAAYQAKVSTAADLVCENMKRSPVVLLSGPSGSGKTTTALKLRQELERRGVGTHAISMDDYFLGRALKEQPLTPDGSVDYESPEMMDLELLGRHFSELTQGKTILVPHFEFARQIRNDSKGRLLRLGKDEVAIFEGIHALNTKLTADHPEAMRLYISARSLVMDGEELRFKGTWMRLTRRAVRDYNFRGTGVQGTLDMWDNVRRGEILYISPYKNSAHYMFDSSLPYEVPVMANYAKPLMEALPKENQRLRELKDLVAAFDWFERIDPKTIPAESLLHEFIG